MIFGYACINMSIENGSPNKRVTMKKLATLARDEQVNILLEKSKANVKSVKDIVKWNIENGIGAYRISSDIFPLATHENVIDWWEPTEIFAMELEEIGKLANEHNHLLSLHPGQFTVLTSDNETTIRNSINELEHHHKVMESLNLNYTPVINIHGGGKYGTPELAKERFIKNWDKLSYGVRNMITLENDQSIYNPDDILELCRIVDVPMVFDSAHWEYNKGSYEDIEDILIDAFSTWPKDRIKKVHISSQKPGVNRHAHADFIEWKDVSQVLSFASLNKENFVVMFECKMKNLALLKLRDLGLLV